jgi:hypothetical protein
MPRFLTTAIFLAGGIALTGCGRKPNSPGAAAPTLPTALPTAPPAATESPHALFIQLNARHLFENPLSGELKAAFDTAGPAVWGNLMAELRHVTVVDPTTIDTLMLVVPKDPRFGRLEELQGCVLIVTTKTPFARDQLFAVVHDVEVTTDARGFIVLQDKSLIPGQDQPRLRPRLLAHVPHAVNKTLVLLDPYLAESYLTGYAKTPTG